MRYPALALILLSCFPAICMGVGGERICRIIFLQPPRDAPAEFHFFDGTTSHKMPLTSKNFSEVVKLPAGDLMVGMTPEPVLPLEDFPKDAPSAKIAEGLSDFYLIVVSDPDNKTFPFRILPVDVGAVRAEPGQTLWINLSTDSISATLGNESLEVPAGGRVIGKAPLPDNGYFSAKFLYQPDGEGEYLPLMNKSWWFDATSKHLGFIVKSDGRLPKIFTFRDYRTPQSLDQE